MLIRNIAKAGAIVALAFLLFIITGSGSFETCQRFSRQCFCRVTGNQYIVRRLSQLELDKPRMSSIKQSNCPTSVTQWLEYAKHWSKQTGIPVALILAVIDQESDGNPYCQRAEPAYLNKLMQTSAGRSKLTTIAMATGVHNQDIVTSYGLMQPLFMLAYGYGAKSTYDLFNPDTNIRYCSAHLATLFKKHSGNIRKVAGAYNGGGENSQYARDVEKLYAKYQAYLNQKGV